MNKNNINHDHIRYGWILLILLINIQLYSEKLFTIEYISTGEKTENPLAEKLDEYIREVIGYRGDLVAEAGEYTIRSEITASEDEYGMTLTVSITNNTIPDDSASSLSLTSYNDRGYYTIRDYFSEWIIYYFQIEKEKKNIADLRRNLDFSSLLVSGDEQSTETAENSTVVQTPGFRKFIVSGNRCLEKRDYVQALDYYSRALNLFSGDPGLPENLSLFKNLSHTVMILGDVKDSEHYDEFLKIAGGYFRVNDTRNTYSVLGEGSNYLQKIRKNNYDKYRDNSEFTNYYRKIVGIAHNLQTEFLDYSMWELQYEMILFDEKLSFLHEHGQTDRIFEEIAAFESFVTLHLRSEKAMSWYGEIVSLYTDDPGEDKVEASDQPDKKEDNLQISDQKKKKPAKNYFYSYWQFSLLSASIGKGWGSPDSGFLLGTRYINPGKNWGMSFSTDIHTTYLFYLLYWLFTMDDENVDTDWDAVLNGEEEGFLTCIIGFTFFADFNLNLDKYAHPESEYSCFGVGMMFDASIYREGVGMYKVGPYLKLHTPEITIKTGVFLLTGGDKSENNPVAFASISFNLPEL